MRTSHLTALAYFPKITYSRYQKLVGYFYSPEKIWQAELSEICKAGLDENIAHEFLTWRDSFDLNKMVSDLEKQNIATINLGEENYPSLLAEINDPPLTLFVRGKLPDTNIPTIGVVGTRKLSAYGRLACEKIIGELAEHGLTIVSGLALGIDGVAHEIALEKQTKTIAVLGSGVASQYIYPATHQNLAEKIIAQDGAVISEYPPNFKATKYSFPARNRIIAGLSLGTLVIEAPESSGSLITARYALDYNREVMAIPHPITSLLGAGCNKLLKMGARPITAASDVLETLNLSVALKNLPKQDNLPLDPIEAKILKCLVADPLHIDLIIRQTGLPSPTVSSTLSILEIKGQIRNIGNMSYCKI